MSGMQRCKRLGPAAPWLAVVCLLGGLAVLAAAPSALASAPLQFSPPTLVDYQPQELTSVSCPTTGLCVAVDASGHAVISTDPTAVMPIWSASSDIDGEHRITSVSCPSTELCVVSAA